MCLKMSSANWHLFFLGLSVLNNWVIGPLQWSWRRQWSRLLSRSVLLTAVCRFHTFVDKPLGVSSQTWWIHTLGESSNHFWSHTTVFLPFPGPWLVKQFMHICRQTINWINLKFVGLDWAQIWWDNSLLASPSLIDSWSSFAEFQLFPGLLVVKQSSTFADKPLMILNSNLVGELIRVPHVWWISKCNFSYTPTPPLQRSWKGGILVSPCLSVRPSVRPFVRLWTESCPLCIFKNTRRIHFIFAHLIKQLQKVYRV